MKRILSVAVCLLAILFSVSAQDDTSKARACLEDYMSSDGNRVERAFHPSATMKYIDMQTGEFKNVAIADFIARVKAATTQPERKMEIISLNIEGNAASGKIRIETDKVILYDYMNMLRINGEWKIVSKIFSRQNK